MSFAQYTEQAVLNGMFGNVLGCVKTTIAAAATAQTSVTAGTFGSGGATTTWDFATPAATANFAVLHPGTGTTINQYTAPHLFAATAVVASPASFTIASQSIGPAVTAGDIIFNAGITALPQICGFWNTLYIGLSTNAPASGSSANMTTMLGAEPSSTGGYARIVVPNNLISWTAATTASPSVTASAATLSFPASTGSGWSTGATNLVTAFIADVSTLGGGNVIAFGSLGTAQAVNASGITLSFTSATLTVTLT